MQPPSSNPSATNAIALAAMTPTPMLSIGRAADHHLLDSKVVVGT
jgi:hypothetical protein